MRGIRLILTLAMLVSTATAATVFDLQQRKADQWCWKPITAQTPPEVKDEKWIQSPIDRFILAKLEQANLQPAPATDRRTLIRRASFDLIGLPPTPAEVDEFVNDGAPDAFAKVVDRLLASDHFGERWARHWMDVVRYGETRGHEYDPLIPNAWQYRDYLIRAFNADVPYNQFLTEHVAGDLLEHPRRNPEKGFNESILGTGFWFLGEELHSPVDIRQDEADRMTNRIDTLSKAFLGLTVGCARCHDHKFDAISQKDFYALTGFALSAGYRQVPFMSMEQNRKVAEKLDALRSQASSRLVSGQLATERAGLDRTADYLMAARQVLISKSDRAAAEKETAASRSLDPGMLHEWTTELIAAQKEPGHLLHLFAELAMNSSVIDADSFSRTRQAMRGAMRLREDAVHRFTPDQVLLDFESAGPECSWYADGVAFGLGPVRVGQIVIGNSEDHSALGVASRGMAMRDWAFADLHATPGNETDAGTLGNWNRAGQTIRTATLRLKTGKLWYLVRGAGRAYAAVDSHLMVMGPLHGAVLNEWTDKEPGRWRWVNHDLSAYAGERCHVEFSPVGKGDLEIAKVIEASAPPPLEESNAIVAGMIADPAIHSIGDLAEAYRKMFGATMERLTADTVCGSSDAGEQAAVADFIIRRQGLFTSDAAVCACDLSRQKFLDAQAALAAEVVSESPTAPAMWEGNGVDENVLIRGVAKNPGDPAPRRLLEAIAGADAKPYPTIGSGRLRLAQEMLAQNDPFVARVMVNRVWEHLFGRGIVPTVDNFGVLGQAPTHPELLDYLSDHFRADQAWSIKKLIRSITLSSAYQMSSKVSLAAEQADPQNLMFHHMPIRRLEGEAIRDAILSISGRLDPKIGGRPVEVHVTEFMDGRGRPDSGPLDGAGRRSIYTRVRRNFLPPMMLAFDTPLPFACVGRRNISNVPAQALILMNDPLVIAEANLWAKHVLQDPTKSPRERIVGMFEVALSRRPRPEEIEEMMNFLDEQAEGYGASPEKRTNDQRVWADLCHVMFNMKEFVFVE